jgi:hypothetical protein
MPRSWHWISITGRTWGFGSRSPSPANLPISRSASESTPMSATKLFLALLRHFLIDHFGERGRRQLTVRTGLRRGGGLAKRRLDFVE